MSQPSNQPVPHYVVCRCQHCDGHIEFDANEFAEENSIVPCPHYGLETKIFIPVLQTEKVPTDLPSSVASPNAVRREGFFCGEDAIQETGTGADGEPIPTQVTTSQQAQSFIPNAKQVFKGFFESCTGKPQTQSTISNANQGPTAISNLERPTLRLRKSKTVILTKAQCENPLAKELIDLLFKIEKEGFGTDTGVRRLSEWLETNADSEIPAVGFLLDITREVLSCGNLTPENADKMQNAIVRVLPRHIQITEINSEDFSEKLPARKSMLKRIRELGGNPPPGITRAEAYALKAKLQSQPSEKQLEYIHALGGNPPPDITRWDASELIEQLLSSTKATEKQFQYIRDLGGNPPAELSRTDAETLIPQLQAKQQESLAREQPPTSRQMMVLRFWNRMDLAQSSKWEVEQWLSQFYDKDPRRKAAWETFKLEYGDDGSQHDPSWVTLGAGERYLNKTG
jgi:hypothetical protein